MKTDYVMKKEMTQRNAAESDAKTSQQGITTTLLRKGGNHY